MEGLGGIAYLHERKAQEIEATPQVRIVYPLIVSSEAYAPNSVHRARLHEDS